MDRNTILVNLRCLRDLELIKLVLEKRRREVSASYQKELKRLSSTEKKNFKKELSSQTTLLILLVGVICAVAAVILLWIAPAGEEGSLLESAGLGALLAGVICVIIAIGRLIAQKRIETKNREIQMHNQQEMVKLASQKKRIEQLQQEQKNREAYLNGEIKKVDDLLAEGYDTPLIPDYYQHSLAKLQAIYEYMAAAPVSLKFTLSSPQLGEDIKEKESHVTEIMKQQFPLLLQRYRSEGSRQIERQNEQAMLSLAQKEGNKADAALYKKICIHSSKTFAFFQSADYLDTAEV